MPDHAAQALGAAGKSGMTEKGHSFIERRFSADPLTLSPAQREPEIQSRLSGGTGCPDLTV